MPGAVRKPHLSVSRLVGAVSNCAVSTHMPIRCGWKSQLPDWIEFDAVFNRPYRAWGTYRITDLFSKTSYNLRYIWQIA